MPEVSALLRTARQSAGLTQAELGARVGRSQASIAALERRGANPRIETIDRVLAALGRQLELRAAERPSSVDETLIARNLRFTPAQRLAQFNSWQASHERLMRGRWVDD